jgi:hypothetical protein
MEEGSLIGITLILSGLVGFFYVGFLTFRDYLTGCIKKGDKVTVVDEPPDLQFEVVEVNGDDVLLKKSWNHWRHGDVLPFRGTHISNVKKKGWPW